jgi:hypothetical protein
MIPMTDNEMKIFKEFSDYPTDETYPTIIDFVRKLHFYKEEHYICFAQQDYGSRTRYLVFRAKFENDGTILFNLKSVMELPELVYPIMLKSTQDVEEFNADLPYPEDLCRRFDKDSVTTSQAQIPIGMVKDIFQDIASHVKDSNQEVTLIEAAHIYKTNKYLLCIQHILPTSETKYYYLASATFDQIGRMRLENDQCIPLDEKDFHRFITMLKHLNAVLGDVNVPNYFNKPESVVASIDAFHELFVTNARASQSDILGKESHE